MHDRPCSRRCCSISAAFELRSFADKHHRPGGAFLAQRSDTMSRSIRQGSLKCTPVVTERLTRRSSVLGVAWPRTCRPKSRSHCLTWSDRSSRVIRLRPYQYSLSCQRNYQIIVDAGREILRPEPNLRRSPCGDLGPPSTNILQRACTDKCRIYALRSRLF
jgi:hypothetical protein